VEVSGDSGRDGAEPRFANGVISFQRQIDGRIVYSWGRRRGGRRGAEAGWGGAGIGSDEMASKMLEQVGHLTFLPSNSSRTRSLRLQEGQSTISDIGWPWIPFSHFACGTDREQQEEAEEADDAKQTDRHHDGRNHAQIRPAFVIPSPSGPCVLRAFP